jgi:hypothetical protein
MSHYSTLTASRPDTRMWRRNQNTVRFRLGAGLGPVSNAVIVAIMLAVLGILYLTQLTAMTSTSRKMRSLARNATSRSKTHDCRHLSEQAAAMLRKR